jgi:plastocyanin
MNRTPSFRPVKTSAYLLLATLLGSAAATAGAGIAMVSQKNRSFSLKNLQIMHGDHVKFLNEDTFTHQIFVHSPTMNYESDEQEPGTNVEIPFPTAGTFEVRCEIHPKMLLVVEVK